MWTSEHKVCIRNVGLCGHYTLPAGALRISGRYHVAIDVDPSASAVPALYTSLTGEVATWEKLRQILRDDEAATTALRNIARSRLAVELSDALDCTDAAVLGLASDHLCGDDRTVTQAIGVAAVALGVEAILARSATSLGNNLIIFTSQLRPGSAITLLETIRPQLP